MNPLQTLTEQVRAAHAARQPLAIRGGATKAFHPQTAGLAGEPLDMRALSGILSHEPTELVITARAGTPLAEIETALAEHGQYLPFEPPQFGAGGTGGGAGGGTLGGMVAAGLSGPARASVGAVRDYVLGMEILNGQGQLLRFGGQVMKNVAGYDVARLMAGSWGQLGVITEVSLKVLPLPVLEATLRFECTQDQALQRLNQWGGQPLPLNASCWLQLDGQALLYVRLRGAQAAVQAACQRMGGERLADVTDDWVACRDQRLPWFANRAADHALWRLSVPQTVPALALPTGIAAPLVEWHGGLRWVQAPLAAGDALRAAARQAGGDATVFIATSADITSVRGQFGIENPALQAIHQRLKTAFDPAGILNTGRA
ncbi:MAG: glycolate oxidase subunit GlcE [Burkholderiales bacterium 66-5]|nr:MAG: glycolate oxidase subunit GlcE [Burkholderiales bacterium 66-5]